MEAPRGIVAEVMRADPDGLLLVATNPVDALAYAAPKLSGSADAIRAVARAVA